MMTKPWFGPGPQNVFLKCENFRFLGLGCDLIFDLTFWSI